MKSGLHKFWTVTNGDTSHTNSRSSRYGVKQDAIDEATRRIERGDTVDAFILESVALVQKKVTPIEVVEI